MGLYGPDLMWELGALLHSLSQETESRFGLYSSMWDSRALQEASHCFSMVVKIFHSLFKMAHAAFESPQIGVLTKGI